MKTELIEAYQRARYVIFHDDQELVIRVGKLYSWLDDLLLQKNSQSGVYITAFNPLSKQATDKANQRNNRHLKRLIEKNGYQFLYGYSSDDDENWPEEESFLVFGLPFDSAEVLARKFSQNAFLWIQVGQPVELKFTFKDKYR